MARRSSNTFTVKQKHPLHTHDDRSACEIDGRITPSAQSAHRATFEVSQTRTASAGAAATGWRTFLERASASWIEPTLIHNFGVARVNAVVGALRA